MTDENFISVVIVNWNGGAFLIDCLQSILNQEVDGEKFAIFLIDNNSDDSSVIRVSNFLRKLGYSSRNVELNTVNVGRIQNLSQFSRWSDFDRNVFLVSALENYGYAGAINIGLDVSRRFYKPNFFWIVNSDIVAENFALRELAKRIRISPEIGICGSSLIFESDRQTVQCYGGSRYSFLTGRAWTYLSGTIYSNDVTDAMAESRLNYISGASMFIRSTVVDVAGLFDEDYFLYNEEIDIACKLRRKFRLAVATRSIIYHRVGASIGTEGAVVAASRLSTFFQTRSKLLFCYKHHKIFLPTVWFFLLLRGLKLKFYGRHSEASVIRQVLFGRFEVDQSWFSERVTSHNDFDGD